MILFSYAAAYLSEDSNALFNNLGVMKRNLHMTTCFDNSATLSMDNNVEFSQFTATISAIKQWKTPSGSIYLVAELSDCDWSKELNEYFRKIGAVEDLPHVPHITLQKSSNVELLDSLKVLEGKSIRFVRHVIKVKSRPENENGVNLKI